MFRIFYTKKYQIFKYLLGIILIAEIIHRIYVPEMAISDRQLLLLREVTKI